MGWNRQGMTAGGHLLKIFLVGFFLFNCSLTNAAVPWKKYSYFQNYGGLNDNLSTTEIEDNEATDIQNVVFDTGGVIKKRFGYYNVPRTVRRVDSGVTGITGLSFFRKDNSNRYLVTIANKGGQASAYKKTYISGGGLPSGDWDNISYVGLPGSYTNNQLATMNVANNVLVITLPASTPVKPFKWDGTGNVTDLTADPDVPTSSLNCYIKNILFLSGNTTFPSRVYFSALGDITDYTVTDFFDVETSDGAKVRAIVSAYNSLYIFKDNSIWRLSGTDRDSFVLEKMVDSVGTLSQQSIAVTGQGIYFVTAQNDIALYDGNYSVQFLSQKIRSTIGGLNFQRASNALGLAFSTYKYVDFDYYVSDSVFPSQTNNSVLLFDTGYKAWTKFKGLNINSWCVADNDTFQNAIYFGDYDGYIYTYPSTQYFDSDVTTSSISAFYQTKWFRYSDVSLGDKYWRLLKTYIQTETFNSSLTVEARSDFEATGSIFSINLTQPGALWDSALWDVDLWGGQNLTVGRNEIEKGLNFFQIRYSNDQVNQGFSIFGFENFIEPTDRGP